MTEISLSHVGEAADLFGEVFRYVDQRIQKQLSPLVHTREIGLECCWDDELNFIQVGTRALFFAPWHVDVQSLQIATDPGCSVTIQFGVAHATSPDVQTIVGTFTAAPFLLLVDTQASATLGATDAPRTSPDTSGYALSNAGFLTELLAHDAIYSTITAVGGSPKLVGLKLGCVVRPNTGDDASRISQPS